MEGVGKYVAPDGVMYSGSYLKDKKHGLGKKTYANGDVYEGLWKEDLPHGIGIYKWDRGDEFNGEWSRGKMHGQGTFVWKSGERYDGQWRNGVEDGTGIFAWPNGSAYKGYWKGGKKNGGGVWWRCGLAHHCHSFIRREHAPHQVHATQGAQTASGRRHQQGQDVRRQDQPNRAPWRRPVRPGRLLQPRHGARPHGQKGGVQDESG